MAHWPGAEKGNAVLRSSDLPAALTKSRSAILVRLATKIWCLSVEISVQRLVWVEPPAVGDSKLPHRGIDLLTIDNPSTAPRDSPSVTDGLHTMCTMSKPCMSPRQ